MDKIYAQILKNNNRVNLIGGLQDKGLYEFDLPLAYTVDITDRSDKDTIQIGMVYDKDSDAFTEYVEPDIPETEPIKEEAEPTIEDTLAQIQVNTEYLVCLEEEAILTKENGGI